LSFGRKFTEILPGRLGVMNQPGTYHRLAEDLDFLRQQGVTAVVSLTAAALNTTILAAGKMTYLHQPVIDFTAPTEEQLSGIMDFMTREIDQLGGMVLVHCGAGLGRSGTVAACYMVKDGMNPWDAIHRLRELRPFSVETPEQEQAVVNYAGRLKKNN
jgi:atypical dual specificity phosphatase